MEVGTHGVFLERWAVCWEGSRACSLRGGHPWFLRWPQAPSKAWVVTHLAYFQKESTFLLFFCFVLLEFGSEW